MIALPKSADRLPNYLLLECAQLSMQIHEDFKALDSTSWNWGAFVDAYQVVTGESFYKIIQRDKGPEVDTVVYVYMISILKQVIGSNAARLSLRRKARSLANKVRRP